MPLEAATYISQLVTTNPANSDGLNQADDHMRLIKAAVQNTFPNFTAAALSSTQAQLDAIAALLVSGVLRGNGAVPAGQVADFAMATAPTGWLECNGAAVSRTTYADLFTAIGTTWGSGDGSTTFNLPPDRYRRGRTAAAAAVGTLQADQNKSHTHTGTPAGTLDAADTNHYHNFTPSGTVDSASTPDHYHTLGGATIGSVNLAHSHGVTGGTMGGTSQSGAQSGGTFFSVIGTGSNPIAISNSASLDHTHTLPANTTGSMHSLAHTHPFTGTGGITAYHSATQSNYTHGHTFTGTALSLSSDGGAEARPLTAVFLTCIKT